MTDRSSTRPDRPDRHPLAALVDPHLFDDTDFVTRHVGPDADDQRLMLAVVGAETIDELLEQTVPGPIADRTLPLPPPRSVDDVLGELRHLASLNRPRTSLIGMGYSGTRVPPVIQRNVLENPAWYTAYTPYQPEISQGRLEALLDFQTMVADLTGFSLANASLLDEATAAAEAMTMARRLSRSASDRFVVHHDTHPQTVAVLATRAEPVGIELVVGDVDDVERDGGCFGALFSLPTSSGAVPDWTDAIARVKAQGGLAVVATDLLACVLMASPASMGADVAIGSAQRFGVPMGFGGPHAAFIAAGESAARALPGRIVGVSTDTAGRPALRLALQTREQHIRREKATSNICTAQVLLANIAGLYACWHGPEGLRRIAERTHRLTSVVAAAVTAGGLRVLHDTWFDTLQVEVPDAELVHARAAEAGYDLRRVSPTVVGLSLDETSGLHTVHDVLAVLGVPTHGLDALHVPDGLPRRRTDDVLPQEVFHRYHTEHEMLRYLRRLSDRDLALDRTMIPLGSCTMKLNATVEMLPVTWPQFADLHPYAPDDESVGTRALIAQLEAMLVDITGYDAVSLQPNAGSQGEFAGLLAIRAYHRSRGDHTRDVCLIPSSAHGTNAASAVMAGMRVVVVACDERGDVDVDDLRTKVAEHGDRLAAIMVTYPSTHGVFEERIREICELVHDAGGQVYVDGANLNALVGLARPGRFGADVSHLNLHKTFCIPHGGGGPGVGPVAVRSHLTPFLPGHPLAPVAEGGVGPVSAAPFGSAGILPISWVYIALMGAEGLRTATATAILSANYVAARLHDAFPVLYTNERGRVAHECILDLRPITKATGVTVDDVAKRLMDHGFHAPTMSFPVAGTLMIEPTESETLAEIERFCEAMWSIRREIDEVAAGTWPVVESPLRHAPHTAADLLGDWDRAYPRALGAFPDGRSVTDRYFPPVSRIDSAYGDRHLVCTCEPLEAYAHSGATTVAHHG
ncbi:MAG: aminomethyl-transferring glycine dehydrogenase [Actinobacteria bacterium]|uniref:glycine dehydrogenase (aminomethyl-transferring) n=1 Tax=freshwater metagenome TaxID=449393 RepID=A0A6J6BCS4_9ZZZZ|nr:aminomethyl-transferring glycine dehydrogenase [Actinomycetota bacterium]